MLQLKEISIKLEKEILKYSSIVAQDEQGYMSFPASWTGNKVIA